MNGFSPTGLSAFVLTPFRDEEIDEKAFVRLVDRVAAAGVDSIAALGSTGSYAYLTRSERARIARRAVERAAGTPVIVGVSALRTRHVLEHMDDAQEAGAAAVLLAPMSYQPLTEDDVFGLYADATAHLSVPLIVYDNPGTTRFTFTDELYAAVAALPNVVSIKIPGVPPEPVDAHRRIERLREVVPAGVGIGVSGDAFAMTGLRAGCDVWYSVIGGTLPELALTMTRAAEGSDGAHVADLADRLLPLWRLFAAHGSLRVTAAIAELLGLVAEFSLPLPIRGLAPEAHSELRAVLDALEVSA